MTGNSEIHHIPVMLRESLDGLKVVKGETYIDATIGLGGHSREILKLGGKVIGLDTDERALKRLATSLHDPNLTLVHGNFSHLTDLVRGITAHQVSGVLMDLGTSALELDDPAYGMSFMRDAPLDMRMSQELAVSAKDLVNGLSEKELYDIFTIYSQEQRARAISAALVRARALKPITTTGELAAIINQVYGGRQSRIHPATKVFQALRIAVNDEINNLKLALPQAATLLKPGGRLVIISFHEGEDRVVKQYFKKEVNHTLTMLAKKPLEPSALEITSNPRSRSAKLRLAEKL